MDEDKQFVPLRVAARDVQPATHVRGSVILSSLRSLRSMRLEDLYFRSLPERDHPTIRSLTAGTWAPVEIALLHYDACERLNLPKSTIELIGADTGAFLNSSVLSVIMRVSREAGLSPWNALSNIERLRDRLWQGSALAVTKLGPKEARIDWYGQPAGRYNYYRIAFGAFMLGIMRPMAKSIFVRPLERTPSFATLAYNASWV